MRQWLSKAYVRVIAAVAAWVAAVILCAAFIRDRGAEWPASIGAVSTLALLLVTYKYVVLTERLARAQEKPLTAIRLQIAESAARSVAQALNSDMWRLEAMAKRIATACAQDPPKFDFNSDDKDTIRALTARLSEHMINVPATIVVQAHHCVAVLLETELKHGAAMTSTLREQLAAKVEKRDFDPARVEANWATIERPNLRGKPEWDHITSGEYLMAASDACQRLDEAITEYLLQE